MVTSDLKPYGSNMPEPRGCRPLVIMKKIIERIEHTALRHQSESLHVLPSNDSAHLGQTQAEIVILSLSTRMISHDVTILTKCLR